MLTLIVLLPLLGFLLNGVLATRLGGSRVGKPFVTVVGCGLPILSFLLVLKSFFDLRAGGFAPLVETAYRWALIGDSPFEIAFYFDRLTAVMALIVTGVGSVIHVYSVGYMAHDKSFGRFFAYLNLFLFFMLLLVLGRSLLVLFVGWEGVGLASYLLIGFWFEEGANARAGKKAFVVNRIGDAGFLLGMFLLFQALGTLDMDRINAAFGSAAAPAVSASLVGLLLFIGATGKSAQIPLHVWLPDAMAGPTPVSALIHAATMVTAGIYLVARLSGVYLQAPEASAVIAAVGVTTAFFAATIAMVQTDIKKVLAYSTVSQLGFMFLALGVGAYGVAVFHVVTHAFFKACLFLGAGSVIHALGGEQDVRRMGGLAMKIPVTFVTFAVATAAIAGIPPLAGFFSKDEILWYAFASTRGGSPGLWGVATLTALMTAFYMFRLLWLTFLGRSRMQAEVEAQVHESPLSMTGVLALLALLSALGGFFALPHFLQPQLPLPAVHESLHHLETPLLVLSVLIAVAGLAGAAFVYGAGTARADGLQGRLAGLHRWLSGKYFIDELYERAIGRPLVWVSDALFLRLGDRRLLDGTLNGLAALGQRGAGLLSRLQTGNLHLYAWFVLMGIVGALLWSWRHVEAFVLDAVLFLPLLGAGLLLASPTDHDDFTRRLALIVMTLQLLLAAWLYARFDSNVAGLQFETRLPWIESWGVHYQIGLDGYNILLVMLTAFLGPLVTAGAFSTISKDVKLFYAMVFLIQFAMMGAFLAQDLFLFYVFWETMLIPMFMMIGIWGGERRIYATIKFFLYTAFGSILMLAALIYLVVALQANTGVVSFAFADLVKARLPLDTQSWLLAAFALSFAIKVPMVPLHTWLPDAHVEAPTAGSVILAGVLLKMGTYGFMKLGFPLFPDATALFTPWLMTLAVISIVYGACLALVQDDIKKIIAYSSISHLGYVMLGLLSLDLIGIQGAVIQMVSHGLVAAGLFLMVGMIYERCHTRELAAYGGLAKLLPVYSVFFMILTLASVGLPTTSGFTGEFLVLLGAFKAAWPQVQAGQGLPLVLAAVAVSGVVLGALYMLRFALAFLYGTAKAPHQPLSDLSGREKSILGLIVVAVFALGLFPDEPMRKTELAAKAYRQLVTTSRLPGSTP